MSLPQRSGDRFGLHRVIAPKGVLPQAAQRLDTSLPIYENELLIEVEALNIDSASFRQIKEHCGGREEEIRAHLLENIKQAGKQHNWETGSGGMLVGTVKEVGARFSKESSCDQAAMVKPGQRVATLVSLTLTPLFIDQIHSIEMHKERVIVSGYAILFSSGIFTLLPSDFSPEVTLSLMDVCGAPTLTKRYVRPGQTVAIFGGAGKSGILCVKAAQQVLQSTGRLVVLDYSQEALDQLASLGVEAQNRIVVDATNAVQTQQRLLQAIGGEGADLVINTANIGGTESASILCTRPGGSIIFFSMATHFQRCALSAEGLGQDIQMIIGNGYAQGHASYALDLIRSHRDLRDLFVKRYS